MARKPPQSDPNATPAGDIRKPEGEYHHGDLRAALIEAASVILETRGPDALSLRAAARRAGVSEAAPYRHFADKAALVEAVIARAVAALGEEIEHAVTPYRGEGLPALHAGARAHLNFAIEQPGRYRLAANAAALGGLADYYRADAGSDEFALAVLAQVHGLAVLVLAGAINRTAADECIGLLRLS